MDKWRHSDFFDGEEDPLTPLTNLVDIILVFCCGLIAALVAISPDLQQRFQSTQSTSVTNISLGDELPQVPEKIQQKNKAGEGFESLGQVYRDPKTGKLILISQ